MSNAVMNKKELSKKGSGQGVGTGLLQRNLLQL